MNLLKVIGAIVLVWMVWTVVGFVIGAVVKLLTVGLIATAVIGATYGVYRLASGDRKRLNP